MRKESVICLPTYDLIQKLLKYSNNIELIAMELRERNTNLSNELHQERLHNRQLEDELTGLKMEKELFDKEMNRYEERNID